MNSLSLSLSLSLNQCTRGVVANVLDCDIVGSEFELESHYHVHFQTNAPGKGMKPLIPSAMGKIARPLFSKRRASAYNNPWRLICHYTRNPNKTSFMWGFYTAIVLPSLRHFVNFFSTYLTFITLSFPLFLSLLFPYFFSFLPFYILHCSFLLIFPLFFSLSSLFPLLFPSFLC